MAPISPTCALPASRRILMLGGGFGGVYAALELERRLARDPDIEITLVTRDNYFLFTPMLHEVAASDLEVSNVVNPLRKMLRRTKTFVGAVEAIDLAARRVAVSHGADGHRHELGYDHLVLALGSTTNFFGLPGVQQCAFTMRSLADAQALRNRLITHLEEASSECAAGFRQPLLTFVVAGGGFAGVETMGAINDFVREALPFFPTLRAEQIRMILVTPDELILPELGPDLGRYAQAKLAQRGVEIVTRARVHGIAGGVVTLSDGRTIETTTLVWTAGTAPNPLVATLPVARAGGRIVVDETLAVPDWPGVWALGDCAAVPDPATGGVHPPTAQHALREGRHAARNIVASLRGECPRPFRFSTLGQLAAIGRRTGVARVLGYSFSGFVAWWLWRTVYLGKLPRLEKKVRVALDWTLDLCFAKDFACVALPNARASRADARLASPDAAAPAAPAALEAVS
ncbi:MAG TPA: NAD(P)/FAD-dependent oxidoreductase [Candidatus Limnocylindria bacterium]|nr:NAD(P)/FAD-dependent oxidoreductase [Candidatus Limnocylindria bacterium]